MVTTSSPQSPGPPVWTDILERIQKTLTQTLAAVSEREQRLQPQPSSVSIHDAEAWRRSLEAGDAGLKRLRSCSEHAERDTAEADSALAESELALAAWLQAATTTRQKLAERAAYPI